MKVRRLFQDMEYVMQEMKWDYPTLMRCIYGLAKPDELSEQWVQGWLDRQIKIIQERAQQ